MWIAQNQRKSLSPDCWTFSPFAPLSGHRALIQGVKTVGVPKFFALENLPVGRYGSSKIQSLLEPQLQLCISPPGLGAACQSLKKGNSS